MHFKRLLNTSMGKFFISVLLGLGLATFFRKVCTDKNCISFNGPVISDIDGKIYKYGEKCYKYTSSATTCDSNKKVVEMSMTSGNVESSIAATNQPKSIFGQ